MLAAVIILSISPERPRLSGISRSLSQGSHHSLLCFSHPQALYHSNNNNSLSHMTNEACEYIQTYICVCVHIYVYNRISFSKQLIREVLLLFSFYRWGNQRKEGLSIFPQVILIQKLAEGGKTQNITTAMSSWLPRGPLHPPRLIRTRHLRELVLHKWMNPCFCAILWAKSVLEFIWHRKHHTTRNEGVIQ